MKHTNILLLLCLMTLVAFNLSSCSKDDDDKDSKKSNSLVGVWANDKNPYQNEPGGIDPGTAGSIIGGGASVKEVEYYEEFFEFDKDGNVIQIVVTYDKNMKQKELDIYLGKYQMTNKGFKVIDVNAPEYVTEFYAQFNGESMILEEVGDSETSYFHRIDRAEFEKYLLPIKQSGNPEKIIGAWSNWYAKSVGKRVELHIFDYKNDGTFRDYTLWFTNKPEYYYSEFSWEEKFFDDFEFISSEYEDYQWKTDGCVYYQRKKGQNKWDMLMYAVNDYTFNFYSEYNNGYFGGLFFTKQWNRMDKDLFADFIKNAKNVN